MREYVLGVTGASGSVCARSVLRNLLTHPDVGRVHVIFSRFSLMTISAEIGARVEDEDRALDLLLRDPSPKRGHARSSPSNVARSRKIVLHRSSDMAATVSSGSCRVDGMVVIPCSGGTLAAIGTGVSSNLIHRAAEVTLKERRPLILAFRETPVSLVHIENMRRVTLAGAVVYPLTPAFYTRPAQIDEIVEGFTARIFDLLHLEHRLGKRWGSPR